MGYLRAQWSTSLIVAGRAWLCGPIRLASPSSRLPVDFPVPREGRPLAVELGGPPLGQVHRAVLLVGAADGDGDVAAPVRAARCAQKLRDLPGNGVYFEPLI